MNVLVKPSPLKGTVHLIGSKSLSHRYLIGAALSDQPSILRHRMQSDDIQATEDILKAFGVRIQEDKVEGPLKHSPKHTLNAQASGSTLRFLIPLALLFDEPITFIGKDRLPSRSLEAYKKVCQTHHLTFKPKGKDTWLPLTVEGPLKAGHYEMDGSVSSQFISGMLFVLPLLDKDSTITLTTPLVSKPYVDMTIRVLEAFNIHIKTTKNGYVIPGQQRYQAVDTTIESDYSHSVFFLAAGAWSGPLTLQGLNPVSWQGDAVVRDLIQSMSGTFTQDKQSLTIQAQTLDPLDADFEDCPDLVPMMALLAARANGTSHLRGLSRLVHKESDRLHAVQTILDGLDVPHELKGDTLIIQGVKSLRAKGPLPTFDDHRLVMATLMLAPVMSEPYIIEGVESVTKSYPEFLDVFTSLGGVYEVL